MVDSQFISELMLVILEERVLGFDQDLLDDLYAKYEEPSETAPELNQDAFLQRFTATKNYLLQMNGEDGLVSRYSRGFGNFYTLWAVVALTDNLPTAATLTEGYVGFMQKVQTLTDQENLDEFLRVAPPGDYTLPLKYLTNSRGPSTDLGPRNERLTAIKTALLGGR